MVRSFLHQKGPWYTNPRIPEGPAQKTCPKGKQQPRLQLGLRWERDSGGLGPDLEESADENKHPKS